MVFISGAILSGLYPAIILASFNPIKTLKGKVGVSAGKVGIRKILLCIQFGICAEL